MITLFENFNIDNLDYEEISKFEPTDFKVGDYVYYVFHDVQYLRYGGRYLVADIRKLDDCYYVYVNNYDDSENGWFSGKFISEFEWSKNKYNL